MPQLTCPVCGKPFSIPNAWIKKIKSKPTCSRECAANLRRIHPKPQPPTGIECICACGCGETFIRPLQCPNRIYKKGHGRQLNRPDFVNVTCHECGKPFRLHQSRLDRFEHVYCSRLCSSKAHTGQIMITRPCSICGKLVTRIACRMKSNHVICSRECQSILTTQIHSCKVQTICDGCGKPIEIHPSTQKKNKKVFCSWECRNKHIYGQDNPAYRSGQGRRSYYGKNWKSQRHSALHRDNYTCQYCGKRPKKTNRLHVHHITPAYLFNGDWQTANELSNLITLCHKCHKDAERELISVQRSLL